MPSTPTVTTGPNPDSQPSSARYPAGVVGNCAVPGTPPRVVQGSCDMEVAVSVHTAGDVQSFRCHRGHVRPCWSQQQGRARSGQRSDRTGTGLLLQAPTKSLPQAWPCQVDSRPVDGSLRATRKCQPLLRVRPGGRHPGPTSLPFALGEDPAIGARPSRWRTWRLGSGGCRFRGMRCMARQAWFRLVSHTGGAPSTPCRRLSS